MKHLLMLCSSLLLATGCADLSDWHMSEPVPDTLSVPAGKEDRLAELTVQTLNREDLVGMQLAVAPLSGEIWTISAGTADLDRSRPVHNGSLFRLGSLTKPFTAAIILQLADTGAIELDQPVSAYLPDCIKGNRFTVRQLLNHQSGIMDIFSLPDLFLTSTWFPDKFWNHRSVLNACLERDLLFTPGTDTAYSSANYILLGLIAEKITGKKPDQLYHELSPGTWFLPYENRPDGLVNGHVDRFVTMGRWYEVKPDNTAWGSAAYTSGALVSGASNVLNFGQALFSASLFNQSLLAAMTNIERNKGLGVIRYTPGGEVMIGHEGEITGYTAAMLLDPATGMLYAACCNTTPFDIVAFLGKVREVINE